MLMALAVVAVAKARRKRFSAPMKRAKPARDGETFTTGATGGDMNERYFDNQGNPVTLFQLVNKEPEWAANRIRVLTEENGRFKAESDRLRKCCTQRGARMQIMREWMAQYGEEFPGGWVWWWFCDDHPDADNWFDQDGVPVSDDRPTADGGDGGSACTTGYIDGSGSGGSGQSGAQALFRADEARADFEKQEDCSWTAESAGCDSSEAWRQIEEYLEAVKRERSEKTAEKAPSDEGDGPG